MVFKILSQEGDRATRPIETAKWLNSYKRQKQAWPHLVNVIVSHEADLIVYSAFAEISRICVYLTPVCILLLVGFFGGQ